MRCIRVCTTRRIPEDDDSDDADEEGDEADEDEEDEDDRDGGDDEDDDDDDDDDDEAAAEDDGDDEDDEDDEGDGDDEDDEVDGDDEDDEGDEGWWGGIRLGGWGNALEIQTGRMVVQHFLVNGADWRRRGYLCIMVCSHVLVHSVPYIGS